MGGPGREAFEGAAWFDAHVIDGAVNGAGHGRCAATAGELRKGQTGYVRSYAGDHRRRRRAAARLVRRRARDPVVHEPAPRVPDPHRARSSCRSSARSPSPLAGKRRPELVKLVALLVERRHRRAQHLAARRSSTPATPASSSSSKHSWIEAWGISWHLGVDGISLFLVVLTGVLFPLAILGTDPHHDEKPYLAWLLLLEAGVMGSFLSLDLFVFFIFFEIVLVPMYFLIGGWGYDDRQYAAMKFFLFTMFGSAFMLVGIVATVFLARARRRPPHVRPRRASPSRPTSRRRPGAGCSSPSPSRSP